MMEPMTIARAFEIAILSTKSASDILQQPESAEFAEAARIIEEFSSDQYELIAYEDERRG